jgi:hypothetical protein
MITKAPVAIGADWKNTSLPDGFHFSHQQDLPLRNVEDGNRTILLFGHSLGPVGHEAKFADGMSGRFGWIDWPYLYPDACALFPIYFGSTPEGLLVSSSLALAVQAAGSVTGLRTVNRKGLNWTPVGGDIAGFRRLLRDQRLHIPTGATEYIGRAAPPTQTVAEARDKFAASLVELASELRNCAGTVHLAMTAGLDSRTLMAGLVAADVRFECYTQSFKGVDRNDIAVARRLARRVGVKHRVVTPEQRNEAVYRIWCEHTANTYNSDDTFLMPQNQYRFIKAGDVLVRGNAFEVGRWGGKSWRRRLRGLDFTNATGELLWAQLDPGPPDPASIAALDDWLAWRRQHDNGLDFVDAFYIDQRVGGWVSAVEHAKDMLPGVSLPLANCQRLLSAMMIAPREERPSGRVQREAIEQLAPGLLKIPINPKTFRAHAVNTLSKTKSRLKRVLGKGTRAN